MGLYLFALIVTACGGRAEFDGSGPDASGADASAPVGYVGRWRFVDSVCTDGDFKTGFDFWLDIGVDTLTTHLQGSGCEISSQAPITVDQSKLIVDRSNTVFSCEPPQCDATAWAISNGNRGSAVAHCPVGSAPEPDAPTRATFERNSDKLTLKSNDGICVATFVKE